MRIRYKDSEFLRRGWIGGLVKIAIIALPQQEKSNDRVAPPLPLCYMAALLEQQRHIIRIYDLALEPRVPIAEALSPLRIFRPQMVVIAADDPIQVAAVEAALDGWGIKVVQLATSLREFTFEQ